MVTNDNFLAQEKIFITLNLADAQLNGKYQLIHVEHTKDTTFAIVGKFQFTCLKGGEYEIHQMELKIKNLCGIVFELDDFLVDPSPNANHKLLLKSTQNSNPPVRTYPVSLKAHSGKELKIEIGMKKANDKNLLIGIRICQIQVA